MKVTFETFDILDVVIIRSNPQMTNDQSKRITDYFRKAKPGVLCIVAGNNLDIETHRKEDLDPMFLAELERI